jgi:serine/threonine-protein kinase
MALEADQIALALPGYEVGGTIGRGAWGQVLSGRHRALGRDVAIKQLPRAFAADPTVRGRFVTEGRLLASLDHPHIVPVFDFVEQGGVCVLVMEMLPGGTVWDRFTSAGFTPPAACATVLAAAAGLHAAHQKSVLHRDVKPENLMFSGAGVLKVTDFGIAKVVGGEATLATRAGEVVGTPAYIAPEQARGAALSAATDVYALATVLYELLSGQLPFADEGDAMALLFRHAYEDPTPLQQNAPDVPAPVVPVVMRALATAPEDRFSNAETFSLALAEACTTAWGPGWLAAEGVAVMGAAAVVASTEHVTMPGQDASVTAISAPAISAPAISAPAISFPAPPVPLTRSTRPAASSQLDRARATVVRPPSSGHADSGAVTDLQGAALSDFVPLQQVVKHPPTGRKQFALAAVAFALAVAVALIGLGQPVKLGGDTRTGLVDVAGTRLDTGTTVAVDLAQPISVLVPADGPAAQRARLSLLLLGRPVLQATAPLTGVTGSAKTADVDLSEAHYLVGGHLTTEVDLLSTGPNGGTVVGSWRFAARSSEQGWLTAAGAVVAALALFSLAYVEQFGRALWRGRRRTTATAGLGPSVAVLAIDIVGVAWLSGVRQPTLPTLVACAVLGLVAGFSGASAATRAGRYRRLRRRKARLATAGAAATARRAS